MKTIVFIFSLEDPILIGESSQNFKLKRFKKYLFLARIVYNLTIKAVSSAVEHLPYKQMATGSNPVPPSENSTESFDLGLPESLRG
jgi:hypothetical protein